MRKQLLNVIERILEWALIISASLMILIVLLQIVARYALPWSPHWTEEMSRFCFVYMVSIGAGLALKDNAYVSVNTFLDRFSMKARLYMESVILCLIIVLMLIMCIYSFPLLTIVRLQTSAALQINMAFIYFSMLLMSFFVLLYAALQLTEKLKNI